MPLRLLAVLSLSLLAAGSALAQQPTPIVPTPLPPPDQNAPSQSAPAPAQSPSPNLTPPDAAPPAAAGPSRDFCGQSVTYRLADPSSAPPAYRPFIGIWSDAAWTPQLCAALIVESVADDGTATISYAFGPIGSGNQKPGGVLHGTGVIQNDELKFQNNDGSQYSFKLFYADIEGRLTTAKGDTYQAIFKKTF